MSRSVFLVMLIINAVASYPLQDEEELRDAELKIPEGKGLKAYVEAIRNGFQEVVVTKYKYLTPNDFNKAQEIFDEFEERFSNDLDSVLIRSRFGKIYSKKPAIEDGLSNETFQIFKQRIKKEIPDIGENAADELVFRFRRNLMWTRFKIDVVISESRTLQHHSSEEE